MPRSWGSYLILTALSVQQGTHLSLVAPLLNEWGYPPALIGLLVSVLSVASLLARIPAGLLYRTERARRVQAVAVPLTALFLFLHPFAQQPLAFGLVRVLSGVAYGVGTTVNLARFIDEQPLGPHRARLMGYYVASIAIGYSIASSIVGYVVEAWGYVPAFGVGAALVLLGTLGALDRTPVAPSAAPAAADSGAGRGASPVVGAPRTVAMRDLFRVPAFAVLAFETFLLNAQWAFWNAWLPLYTLAVGITLAETGLLRTGYGVLNAAGRLVAGDLVSRLGASRLAVGSLVLQCALLVLLPALPAMAPLLAIFVLMGALRAFGIVANTVAVVERGEAHRVPRGPLVGLLNFVTDIGILAGPALGGLVAQGVGPVQVFVVWPLAMLVSYLVVLAVGRVVEGRRSERRAGVE